MQWQPPQGWRRVNRAAHGQIVVVFAFMIVVLLGMVGLAIDIAHSRAVAQDVEAAAQAAALAGVAYLPESSTSTPAENTAISVAAANGFPNSGGTSVVPVADSVARRLKVTVTTRVTTPFLSVLGLGTITVSRSAMAAYSDPIKTGAPDHVLGYAPYPTTGFTSVAGLQGYYPQGFYLEVRGPYTGLEHGDAFSPYFETANPDHLVATDGSTHQYVNPCTGGIAPVNGTTPSYYDICTPLTPVVVPPPPPPTPTYTPSSTVGPAATLVPNPYYNQQNLSSGQTGYSYIFSLPPRMTHQVLLKVLDPLDECALDTNSTMSPQLATGSTSTVFTITNVASGLQLNQNNPDVVQGTPGTAVNWQEVPIFGKPNVYKLLDPATSSYLDVQSTSLELYEHVLVKDGSSSDLSQQWTLTPEPPGQNVVYAMINARYGTYADSGGSVNGAQITLAPSAGTTAKWTFSAAPTPITSYQYEGNVVSDTGGALPISGHTVDSDFNDWPVVSAAQNGTGVAPTPTATPALPSLINEGSAQIDQCGGTYWDHYRPTTLKFTIHMPSSRTADNTAPVPMGTTTIMGAGGASITVGVNPIFAGPEYAAVPVTTNCGTTCKVIGTHAFQWLTIAEAYNPTLVPVYVRVSVESVVNSAYWANSSNPYDPYTGAADHPFDSYGGANSGTYGDGGNVFALGLCDIGSVTSPIGSQSNTDTTAEPIDPVTGIHEYGNIFNAVDWSPADTSGLDPDKNCPDPNLDTAFLQGPDPIVTPLFRFQVNGRDGMGILTLSYGQSSSSITDYIPLAELGPHFAGLTVTVRLFDAGDIVNASNYISILGPGDNPSDDNFIDGTYLSTAFGSGKLYPTPVSFKSEPYHLDILSPPNSNYSNAGTNRPPWWCNHFTGGSDYPADNPPAGHAAWCPPANQNPIDQGVQVSENGHNGFSNGVWLEFQIPIPANYAPAPGQDWWKVAYNMVGLHSGSYADDTTTWQVVNSAAPIQLVTSD